jgi:predicted unusual protein kinase regulating ubiquinone biosynthesis (AarF/ABC1/UbiB family)
VASAFADPKRRRRVVEERLREAGRPRLARRSPPPEGRLGADEQPMRALCDTLSGLGPVFASFGRYLSSRVDLLPRRDRLELARIPDRGEPIPESRVESLVQRELGAPPERRFFAFDPSARDVRVWTERHEAWLVPGVPVTVTIVRPDAASALETDLPLLPLLAPWFGAGDAALADAIEDFEASLRQRLDQVHQASALGKLAGDARAGGLFDAPLSYRSHCSASILTTERIAGWSLRELAGDGPAGLGGALGSEGSPGSGGSFDPGVMARRLAGAWLRQATVGSVVPYDFDQRDVFLRGDRLLLAGGSFEAHSSASRARFLNYINAVAADDPDAAAAWLMADAVPGGSPVEDEIRRRLRQAVPFRDGEWSGDERLAEQVLVQWRMTRLARLDLPAHHLRLYRGVHALSVAAGTMAPDSDALLAALQEERLRVGFGTAQPFIDPRELPATLERMLQDMVNLPQKLDEVLTLAADGRLRVKLQLPRDDAARRTRNRTVSLVSSLVVLTALAFALRHVAFAQAPGVEQVGALIVMGVGLWLLVAAARL